MPLTIYTSISIMFEISLRIQRAIMYDWSPYFTTNEVHKERNRYKTQA